MRRLVQLRCGSVTQFAPKTINTRSLTVFGLHCRDRVLLGAGDAIRRIVCQSRELRQMSAGRERGVQVTKRE